MKSWNARQAATKGDGESRRGWRGACLVDDGVDARLCCATVKMPESAALRMEASGNCAKAKPSEVSRSKSALGKPPASFSLTKSCVRNA